MTREKGEMLKTGYLEVFHDQEMQLLLVNEDEAHGVDPEENLINHKLFLVGNVMQHSKPEIDWE